jgi:hypothetical protein
VLFDIADIHSAGAHAQGRSVYGCVLVAVRSVQGAVMPRRKKKYLLLRSVFRGRVIVVKRVWYDDLNMRHNRNWKIMVQSDDESMLLTMAELTDNHMRMRVDHTHEDEKGNITNVRS